MSDEFNDSILKQKKKSPFPARIHKAENQSQHLAGEFDQVRCGPTNEQNRNGPVSLIIQNKTKKRAPFTGLFVPNEIEIGRVAFVCGASGSANNFEQKKSVSMKEAACVGLLLCLRSYSVR